VSLGVEDVAATEPRLHDACRDHFGRPRRGLAAGWTRTQRRIRSVGGDNAPSVNTCGHPHQSKGRQSYASNRYRNRCDVAAGLSGTAMAQSTPASTSLAGPIQSHWTASGFVGSNFRTTGDATGIADKASLNVGGQLGYLWRGILGAEFLGDLSPTFKVINPALADDPSVYAFMANAITAIPLGAEGQIQPYASGGFGRIQMATTVPNVPGVQASGTATSKQSTQGTDFGGGLMAYAGKVGIRGDVRYYRASSNANTSATSPADILTSELLAGLVSGERAWASPCAGKAACLV